MNVCQMRVGATVCDGPQSNGSCAYGDLFEAPESDRLFLDTQFRMPYPLCEFPSQQFYGGNLKTHPSVDEGRNPASLCEGFPWPTVGTADPKLSPTDRTCQPSMRLPLLFIDTADSLLRSQFEQAACNSRQNPV
eukprot:GHVQ01035097.1.p1 GENE.GHVQ01035097.1~~GHVQ01035097.1.p1  ORF type:complete len:134 (-),score=15.33 GHVQ01035097.1:134-535(-)